MPDVVAATDMDTHGVFKQHFICQMPNLIIADAFIFDAQFFLDDWCYVMKVFLGHKPAVGNNRLCIRFLKGIIANDVSGDIHPSFYHLGITLGAILWNPQNPFRPMTLEQ